MLAARLYGSGARYQAPPGGGWPAFGADRSLAAINYLLLSVLLLAGLGAQAAPKPEPGGAAAELYQRIARLDAKMPAAFNAHDIPQLMRYFTPDLDFYHNTGGLAGYATTEQGFTQLSKQPPDIHRDLVSGSLEAYPIPGYGAIEIATRRFGHQKNGKLDCGTVRLIRCSGSKRPGCGKWRAW